MVAWNAPDSIDDGFRPIARVNRSVSDGSGVHHDGIIDEPGQVLIS
jgi:hypothetical protein